MKNKKILVLAFTCAVLLLACEKEENDVAADITYETADTVSTETIENVLAVKNSLLTNSNGDKGMEYNSETGDINFSVSSSKDANYIFSNSLIIAADMDTSAILRKITSIDTVNNVIYLKTEEVEFEELFQDGDFQLDSKMNDDISLKSTSSNEQISAKLTDGHTIHPARIIYHTKDGVFAKSVFSNETIDGVEMINSNLKKTFSLDIIDFDFSGYTILDYSAEVNGIEENMSLTVGEGNVYMGTDFTMNINISWFKLKKCEFYVEPNASTDISINFDASISKTIEGQQKLADITYITYVFYVGVIPISISLDFDLYAEYELSAEGKISAEASFSADLDSKFGAKYVRGDGWTGIKTFSHSISSSLDYVAEVDAHAEASIFPQCCVRIYGINGITLGIKPYLYADFSAGVKNSAPFYSYELGAGLSADLLAQIKILSWSLVSYEKEFEIVSPYEIVSGSSN